MTEAELIGEVVESSTPQFAVACYQLYQAPAFGSLVRAGLAGGSGSVFGLVYNVTTSSVPPGSQVTVRGRHDMRDEDVYRAYPDLPEIMRTELGVLTVGYAEGSAIHQYLPPQPPPLHYAVYLCSPDEVRRFSEQLDYLRTILTNQQVPADELAAAAIRQARACRPADSDFALRAGRQLAQLLKDDYDRLRAILRRIGDEPAGTASDSQDAKQKPMQ